ncbi:Gfo/Idh/MocA family oxidoreductase [Chitiniphilus shinanonensis]|uniref:Gfo/Idh/MocA family oxidoreductase n=1 Tax=Chitiniphilus shinanonensis TaxID=553088 RepID=UPI003073EEF1
MTSQTVSTHAALRLGIVGCAPFTHGRMWAEQWRREPEHGLVAARLWDDDPAVAAQLAAQLGAEVAATPEAVADGCDGVLITVLDAGRYLELARPHLLAGRRVFLNRPLAGSLPDAREILALADAHDARVYSASALLHTHAAERIRTVLAELGELRFFSVTGPTDTADWYLPHLFACLAGTLGSGLARVLHADLPCIDGDPHRLSGPAIVSVAYRADAAVGPARGVLALVGPGSDWYGFTLKLYGSLGISQDLEFDVGYGLMFAAMRDFFASGAEPLPRALLLEQTAAHYAALRAARQGGPVEIDPQGA